MFFKYFVSAFLVLQVAFDVTNASCSKDEYLERRQDLQQYQDASRCIPVTEPWYMLFRNYEEDPALGGTAKCLRGSQLGPAEGDTLPLRSQYSPDVSLNGTMRLTSLEGYDAKNLLEFTVDGETGYIQENVAFGLCEKCLVTRQLYITEAIGTPCALWVAQSKLGDVSMCCMFVFDLLCGTTEKYYVYDESCKGEA